jgi:hypothetical protein
MRKQLLVNEIATFSQRALMARYKQVEGIQVSTGAHAIGRPGGVDSGDCRAGKELTIAGQPTTSQILKPIFYS